MRRNLQRGFTLVELMVVVIIIGVLSAIMIGVSQGSYGGATPENVSNQVVTTMGFARTRAVSTKSWHRVEVTPKQLVVWEAYDSINKKIAIGLAAPAGGIVWKQIQTLQLPDNNVSAWDAKTTVYAAGGATIALNGALDFNIDFKPDGSSTGGTVFISDAPNLKKWRVLVYKSTGSSYARNGW